MKKIKLYPLWLRAWHLINALLFLLLIISGVSLHFSATSSLIISKASAIVLHSICGISLTFFYLFYLIFNLFTKNLKNYKIEFKGLYKRIKIHAQYYFLGIFAKKLNPFNPSEGKKFNPIQQIFYLLIMFVLMPLAIISGWLLFFPDKAPGVLGKLGGVAPMAILHIIVSFLLTLFMLLHIYLGTTGKNVFELYKSMISGWRLADEAGDEIKEEAYSTSIFLDENKKVFPIVFYNPITLAGALIALISFVLVMFLVAYTLVSAHTQPYLGILTFIILPSILVLGLIIILIGAFKENRARLELGEETQSRKLPIIDLNNSKHQRAAFVFVLGTLILSGFSVYGSFKAYEYTESDEFCGTLCHKLMVPEYTAYKKSPHSKVGCVTCHIGAGADWFVKAKLSGSYQVYAALMEIYPKPIPTPVENLRPAQETCEECHRPEHFFAEKKFERNFYASDSSNSHSSISLLMKVGGGSPETGNNTGIHWNMNLKNDIYYYATDRQRANIPWVKSVDKKTGKEKIYIKKGDYISEKMTQDNKKIRKMDCIDCHNRPSHIYKNPNIEINAFLASGAIDKSLPFIKMLGVQTLENYVYSRENSENDIRKYLYNYYDKNFPEISKNKKESLDKSIKSLSEIFSNNYFPDMNVNWKKFPINLGHMYSSGCYRCHDGKHVSQDGEVISQDCNICHSIIKEKTSFSKGIVSGENLTFMHPGSEDNTVKIKNCPVCHGVQSMKNVAVEKER